MNIMNMDCSDIKKALEDGDLIVTIVGLGKVGLTLALIFADAGAQVIGVDINDNIVDFLNKGILPCYEPKVPRLLRKGIKTKHFRAVVDATDATKKSSAIIIVVPTLIDDKKHPDISAVEKAAESVGKGLKKGSIVIIESTVPPGTTEGIIKNILEKKSGLKAGADFGLAFCPERVQSPQVVDDIVWNYPKVVGGLDKKSTKIASCIYSLINKKGIIAVDSPKIAEIEKIAENTYRDINIAFANELALMCEIFGVDVREVIKIANTQPFCNILTPGAGVGGHCIPMDPYYLIDEARKSKFDAKLTRTAREINDFMPQHVVDLVLDGLGKIDKDIKKANIALLGLSYKENTDDYRYSPSRDIINNLHRYNTKIKTFDPYIQNVGDDLNVKHFSELEACVRGVDCIIIATAHKQFQNMNLKGIKKLTNEKCVFVDGRCMFDPEDVSDAGFVFKGVGR